MSYELDSGTVVHFEIEPTDGYQQVGAEQILGRVRDSVWPAVEAARAVLDQAVRLRPSEVEVSFGIKVNGSTNWVVAKAATEANFGVKLIWRPGSDQTGDEAGGQE
ncbi:CU044_2847 family protein [Kitasatospora acidiphila]|uniref:CU044_2847 family protein n=1 Tax=Kitasatospora acidiphila TaxID=2567942 RepID=UPI001E45ED48|nr:CU044_2847 family protein [Kitasatospora acidiphila]